MPEPVQPRPADVPDDQVEPDVLEALVSEHAEHPQALADAIVAAARGES